MRTTLDIDDDVLLAAKELARHDKTSLGQTVSALVRRAFQADAARSTASPLADAPHQVSERLAHYGIRPLPARGGVVSNALIDRLRDAEGI
jgi:hypothetical protein